jgi:hypothetical protein
MTRNKFEGNTMAKIEDVPSSDEIPKVLRNIISAGLIKSGGYDGMIFRQVVLANPLGTFQKGQMIPRVEISWFSGEMVFFDNKKVPIGRFPVSLVLGD